MIEAITWSRTTIRYAISTRDGVSLDPAKADEELRAIGDETLPDPDTLGWENLDNEARQAVITNIMRKTVAKAAELLK
jgi:hypothetical protein